MARILVVDDVKFIAGMIGSMLENAGHDVTIAVSGEEALRKTKEILPDLILLDLMMPGLDGLEVVRLLKSDSTTHPIPVMMISSKNDLNTVAEAFAADVSEFIAKPFETQELMEKVALLLRNFRMTYSIGDVDQIPTVTVLHDEIAVGTIDLLERALRMATGPTRRPIVLDLSRVRRLGPGLEEALADFGRKVQELGEDLQVIQPEAGTRASAIFPGMAALLSLHEERTEALNAARQAARRGGWPLRDDGPSAEDAHHPPFAPGESPLRIENYGGLAVVRLPGPELTAEVLTALKRDCPRAAGVVLLDLSQITALKPAQVRDLEALVDESNLAGFNVKFVNANPAVTESLRSGGLALNLFSIMKKPTRA